MSLRLTDLEIEVILIILEYVHDSSPHSSYAVLQTNKLLNSAVKIILNRRQTFNWSCQDDDVLSKIRHLTVEKSGLYRSGSTPDETYEDFNKIIRRIKNLKSLTWNSGPGVPISLLETLHRYHPSAALRVFCFERLDSSLDHLDDAETALSTYPTLTHFRASEKVSRDSWKGLQYSLATFKNIVASSQSLEYAGIVLPNGTRQLDFPQAEDELLVSSRRNKCQSLKSLTLDGPELKLSKDSLSELDNYIEIAQLQSLKFSRGFPEVSYFENAAIMLPNLKHVALNFGAIAGTSLGGIQTQQPILKAARDYLLDCPPLQTLSLWAWRRVTNLQDLISRHGKTLTTLQLHEKENTFTWTELGEVDNRPDVTVADVQLLRQHCPHLKDLTIDMNRRHDGFDLQSETDIPRLLNELAEFKPQLQKVQIYFDTTDLPEFLYPASTVEFDSEDEADAEDETSHGNSDEDDGDRENIEGQAVSLDGDRILSPHQKKPQPVLETADAEKILQEYIQSIWKQLYGSAATGERLLDVKFGDWETKNYNYLIRQDRSGRFSDDPRRFFEARPHERDDKVGECTIKMRKK